MHGRPRKASLPEEEAASAGKAAKLRALQSQFLSYHQQNIYTKEAIELSAKLLEINPESYTAWNYRKLAVERILTQSDSDPDSVKSVLDEELVLVENALRQNPKSYGAWHHRKWVLSKGHCSVEKELRLVDEFQDKDARNFHVWNYRRFVAALMNRSEEDELKYTQKLINKNFSFYSAWHNRSVLLSNLMKKKVQGFVQKDEVLTREYELVRAALFTDEDDQSGWFYHLWLLNQTVKAEHPLLVSSWPAHGSNLQLRSKMFPLILYFSQPVKGVNSSTITVSSGSNMNKDLIWKPLTTNNSQTARVWVTQLDFHDAETQSSEAYPVEVNLGHSEGIISSDGFSYSCPTRFAFTVNLQPVDSESAEGPGKISWREEDFHVCEPHSLESNLVFCFDHLDVKNEHGSTDSAMQENVLDEEIRNFRDLSDCKIGKLTLARLLTAHDALVPSEKLIHSEEVLKLYSDLMKLDPWHYWYYKDEHSLVLLQQVTSNEESLLSHCFHHRHLTTSDSCNPICLRLNKMSLSQMGSFERLLWVQMLDLGQNELRSIEGLEALQLLSHLNLSRNKLGSFTSLEPLRQLNSLIVLNISYNEIGAHSIDTRRYLCSSPLSHSIGREWNPDEIQVDGLSVTNYWEAFLVLKGLKLTQLDVVGNPIADEKFTVFLVKLLPALKWLDGVQLN